jgi:hypothetical protein
VRCAVDAQVDAADTPATRREKLRRAARKIEYWQRERKYSARSHRKRTLKDLHRKGIRLSEARRC